MGGCTSVQREVTANIIALLKLGLVTIAGKPGEEMAPGTLNSVLKQAGLRT
jgi:predicted RNA binding protein YcfA (HicA-like mRNA interferase family)